MAVSELIRPSTLPETLSSDSAATLVPKSQDPATDNVNNNVVDTSVVDNQTHDESPEKLSLKARLKLFEKEIEQQGSTAPVPRTGKLFFTPSKIYAPT